jgi:hypothetical protein
VTSDLLTTQDFSFYSFALVGNPDDAADPREIHSAVGIDCGESSRIRSPRRVKAITDNVCHVKPTYPTKMDAVFSHLVAFVATLKVGCEPAVLEMKITPQVQGLFEPNSLHSTLASVLMPSSHA